MLAVYYRRVIGFVCATLTKLERRHLSMNSESVRHVSLWAALAVLLTCGTRLAARSQQDESRQDQQAADRTLSEAQTPDAVVSTAEAAKAGQNPLSSLIIVVFQNST